MCSNSPFADIARMNRMAWLQKLIPATMGGKCIVALLSGWLVALTVPHVSPYILPLGIVFTRLTTVVILPYIALELVCSLGKLPTSGSLVFLRSGAVVIAASILIAALVGMFVPLLLPNMITSGFFAPEMLETESMLDLYDLFLPDNLFKALSENNFPAIVIVSSAVGLAIQGTENKSVLLNPLEQLLGVFRRINGHIGKIIPIGIFALSAQPMKNMGWESLLKIHALPLVSIAGALIIVSSMIGLIVSLTPYRLRDIARAIREPLAIAVGSGNLMIALPAATTSLQNLVANYTDNNTEEVDPTAEQISTILPVACVLPNVGQVFLISIVPYMAWFIDRPMDVFEKLTLFATQIPTTTGGLGTAVRAGLDQSLLPLDLMNMFIMNIDWITRLDKSLSVVGLLFITLLVAAYSAKAVKLNLPRLVGTIAICVLLTGASLWALPQYLSVALANAYTNDQVVENLTPLVKQLHRSFETTEITSTQDSAFMALPREVVALDSIRKRGYLRVGVHTIGLPWAARDKHGALFGYDIDMVQALAQALNVDIRYTPASIPLLAQLIRASKIDIAVGGLPDDVIIEMGMNISRGYQLTHSALLVNDGHYWALQQALNGTLGRPLVLGISASTNITTRMREEISRAFTDDDSYLPISIVKVRSSKDFLTSHDKLGIDAYFMSAETGALTAILHPTFTMYPVFGRKLPVEKIMMTGGIDPAFEEFVDVWISLEKQRGLFDRLYQHWVLIQKFD